jgi:hypothetical protein
VNPKEALPVSFAGTPLAPRPPKDCANNFNGSDNDERTEASMRRTVIAALVLGVITLSVAPVVSAPKPSTTASSIVLNGPSGSPLATSLTAGLWPQLGDTITFSVSYPKTVEKYGPRVQVICYQAGILVFGMAGPHNYVFQLGGASSEWLTNGGGADCVADLYYWSYNRGQQFNWLASTQFTAYPN